MELTESGSLRPTRIRLATSLVVPRAQLGEYERRHRDLWPELRQAITAAGGHNFSIFAVPDLDRVFSYVEVDDPVRWTANSATELGHRWWRYMAEIMPTNSDLSPIGETLREVFHQP